MPKSKPSTESNALFQTVHTDDVIKHLKTLGLNSYEAKVYLALLKQHPATGYEVSKNAGIPQARAYDTLKALENQQLVTSTQGRTVTYMPVSPQEVLSQFHNSYKNDIDYLKETLQNYSLETIEPIYNLRGVQSIYDQAVEIIDQARETLFMEIWGEDLPHLEDALKRAHERDVKIFTVGYDNLGLKYGTVYPHDREEIIADEIGWRIMNIAADNNATILGTFVTGAKEPSAVYTKNPTIVTLIKELVIHNMCLLDVEQKLKDPIEELYGKVPRKISRKILGEKILIVAH